MGTETLLIVAVIVVLLVSVSYPYWGTRPDGSPTPAPNFGGMVNTLLYIILVIVLIKVLFGIMPLH
jgi:hypothetical protein